MKNASFDDSIGCNVCAGFLKKTLIRTITAFRSAVSCFNKGVDWEDRGRKIVMY